jgi:hypothetical protein
MFSGPGFAVGCFLSQSMLAACTRLGEGEQGGITFAALICRHTLLHARICINYCNLSIHRIHRKQEEKKDQAPRKKTQKLISAPVRRSRDLWMQVAYQSDSTALLEIRKTKSNLILRTICVGNLSESDPDLDDHQIGPKTTGCVIRSGQTENMHVISMS